MKLSDAIFNPAHPISSFASPTQLALDMQVLHLLALPRVLQRGELDAALGQRRSCPPHVGDAPSNHHEDGYFWITVSDMPPFFHSR